MAIIMGRYVDRQRSIHREHNAKGVPVLGVLCASSAAKRPVAAIFVRFLFALTILLFGSVVSASDTSTMEDRLVCKNTEVRVFTTCSTDPLAIFALECTEQYFLFVDVNKKTSTRISASGQLKERYGAQGRKMGNWLDALALEWACLRGSNEAVVLIGYTRGGICSRCQWYEIFDREGRMLASSKVPPLAKKKEEERINEAFYKKYDALGLPMPWPDSSLQLFRGFEYQ